MSIKRIPDSEVYAEEYVATADKIIHDKVVYLKKDIEQLEQCLDHLDLKKAEEIDFTERECLINKIEDGIAQIEKKRKKLQKVFDEILSDKDSQNSDEVITKYNCKIENILKKAIMQNDILLKMYNHNDAEDN